MMGRPTYTVPCATCKADAGEPCRTRATNRVTDTHAARIWLQYARPNPAVDHQPGHDWHCSCGYDYFGGSAAYSAQLYDSHVVGIVLQAFKESTR